MYLKDIYCAAFGAYQQFESDSDDGLVVALLDPQHQLQLTSFAGDDVIVIVGLYVISGFITAAAAGFVCVSGEQKQQMGLCAHYTCLDSHQTCVHEQHCKLTAHMYCYRTDWKIALQYVGL